MKDLVDVVVVGAGPVGLLTAIELKLAGADVLVLERLAAPSMVIKALAVGPHGSEALRRRGLGPAMAAEEERNLAAMDRSTTAMRDRMRKFGGHFAGLPIPKGAWAQPGRRASFVDQQGLEAMLAARAKTLGIAVRREHDVAGLREDAAGIEVDCSAPTGPTTIRCAYLVGCDGGRSVVRKAAGFAFPGTPPTMTMYQLIATVDRPEQLPAMGWHRTPGGVLACFPGRSFMLDFSGPPADRDAPVTHAEVEAALRRVSGEDVRIVALETASRWTDNTRLVDSYRHGRVLLAGDAAHVHAPFGGQGLSLGLADAANLGWKLAAVVGGTMPDDLLDSYTAERRPVAEAVLANTLAQVAIMRPDPQSGAMRDIVARLLQQDDVAAVFGGMMSGLEARYDLGSDGDEVGRLAGDRTVRHDDGETSLYGLMQDGGGVFLDASAGGDAARLVDAHGTRVVRAAVDAGPSLLIRPDACVAWAGAGTNGLQDALDRWFGARHRVPARRVA